MHDLAPAVAEAREEEIGEPGDGEGLPGPAARDEQHGREAADHLHRGDDSRARHVAQPREEPRWPKQTVGSGIQLSVGAEHDPQADQDREAGLRPPQPGRGLGAEERGIEALPERGHVRPLSALARVDSGSAPTGRLRLRLAARRDTHLTTLAHGLSHSWYSSGSVVTSQSPSTRSIRSRSRYTRTAATSRPASRAPFAMPRHTAARVASLEPGNSESGHSARRYPSGRSCWSNGVSSPARVDGARFPRCAGVVAGDAEQPERGERPGFEPDEPEQHHDAEKHAHEPLDPRRERRRHQVVSSVRYASAPVRVKNTTPPTIAPESLTRLPSTAPA